MTEHERHPDIVEQAIISRLRGLKQMSVDTAQLETTLSRQIPHPRTYWRRVWRPLTAIAASLLIVVAIGLATFGGSSQAHASPEIMAQIHHDIISNKTAMHQTESVEDANSVIAAMIDGKLQLPEVPLSHLKSCCMKEIKDRKMACVLFEKDGVPVTISVAKAGDFKGPASGMSTMNAGGVQMVMMERNGLWVCMMAEMPMAELKSLAEKVKF